MKIYHDGMWNVDELERMARHEFIDRNGGRYGMCAKCNCVIRVDKKVFGSLHFCEPPKEGAG